MNTNLPSWAATPSIPFNRSLKVSRLVGVLPNMECWLLLNSSCCCCCCCSEPGKEDVDSSDLLQVSIEDSRLKAESRSSKRIMAPGGAWFMSEANTKPSRLASDRDRIQTGKEREPASDKMHEVLPFPGGP
eukprot:Lithocolla_globosa_v1_NODE_2572_length_1949_cov_7.144667.p2 type:complete len:131 gc:universal NODE_2572_length_1949_cov_7.144667:488-880(+)